MRLGEGGAMLGGLSLTWDQSPEMKEKGGRAASWCGGARILGMAVGGHSDGKGLAMTRERGRGMAGSKGFEGGAGCLPANGLASGDG